MKQISAEYRVLSESPKLELFVDYFLEDYVVYATAKVIDESISNKKPIWGLELSLDAFKDMSFDDLVFTSLNPKRKLNNREQKKLIQELKKQINEKIEQEVF